MKLKASSPITKWLKKTWLSSKLATTNWLKKTWLSSKLATTNWLKKTWLFFKLATQNPSLVRELYFIFYKPHFNNPKAQDRIYAQLAFNLESIRKQYNSEKPRDEKKNNSEKPSDHKPYDLRKLIKEEIKAFYNSLKSVEENKATYTQRAGNDMPAQQESKAENILKAPIKKYKLISLEKIFQTREKEEQASKENQPVKKEKEYKLKTPSTIATNYLRSNANPSKMHHQDHKPRA